MSPKYKPNLLSCVRYSSLDDIYIDEFTDEPAEGTYLNHFDNDKIEEEQEFKKGRHHGYHRKWWPNGKLRGESHSIEGLLDGKSIGWHFNGQISRKSHWIAGAHHGSYETWWENGNPRCTQQWRDGELLEETHFRSDGTEI